MTDWLDACPICAALDVTLVRGSCPNKPRSRADKWTCDREAHVTGQWYMNDWNTPKPASAETGRGGIARHSDE